MNILIDFDGTVVTHNYPMIGKDIGAVTILKELVRSGHKFMPEIFNYWCLENGR